MNLVTVKVFFQTSLCAGLCDYGSWIEISKNWQPILKYGSLVNFDPQTVTAKQVFDEVCHIRRSKLPDPKEFGNAGSFFKNPVVSAEQFAKIQNRSKIYRTFHNRMAL